MYTNTCMRWHCYDRGLLECTHLHIFCFRLELFSSMQALVIDSHLPRDVAGKAARLWLLPASPFTPCTCECGEQQQQMRRGSGSIVSSADTHFHKAFTVCLGLHSRQKDRLHIKNTDNVQHHVYKTCGEHECILDADMHTLT